jgi:methionyl-tRNA formyltransferase
LKILEAVPLGEQVSGEVGHVLALDGKDVAFGVSTGDGVLGMLKVQLEGKRVMPAAEFLRGQRDWAAMVLPSK